MSDLTATNCGCGCDDRGNNRGGLFGNDCGCSIITLLILLSIFCGGNGFRNGDSCDNNNCCWLIILLLFFCGGDNGFGCFC